MIASVPFPDVFVLASMQHLPAEPTQTFGKRAASQPEHVFGSEARERPPAHCRFTISFPLRAFLRHCEQRFATSCHSTSPHPIHPYPEPVLRSTPFYSALAQKHARHPTPVAERRRRRRRPPLYPATPYAAYPASPSRTQPHAAEHRRSHRTRGSRLNWSVSLAIRGIPDCEATAASDWMLTSLGFDRCIPNPQINQRHRSSPPPLRIRRRTRWKVGEGRLPIQDGQEGGCADPRTQGDGAHQGKDQGGTQADDDCQPP